MFVKICGIKSEKEIGYLNEAMPDFAGFILFFEKSKRNISIEKAIEIKSKLSEKIRTVAVLVEPDLEKFKKVIEAGFDYIQIHGKICFEILEHHKELKNQQEANGEENLIKILKAFNVSDLDDFDSYNSNSEISGFVFDSNVPGAGKTFDWKLLDSIPEVGTGKIMLLAGGLTPDNVAEAAGLKKITGVDVSSGVENENGDGKNREKILEFVKNARAAET